jgi:peptidoglycan/LPS O-acetylase OafA/YrhL
VLRAHTAIALGMIVVGQVSRTWLLLIDYPGATSLPVSNMDYYGFGILLAIGSLREHGGLGLPRPVDWLRRRPAVALAVLAAGAAAMNLVANVAGTTQSRWEDVQRYGVYSLIVVPFMLVMALGYQDRSYNRWFSSRRWGLLALLSLHVYLWHQLVLGGFDRYVTEAAAVQIGSRFTTGVIMATGAVLVTVAWSALLRPVLDRPYLRWSHSLPRPADAAPAPGWLRPARSGSPRRCWPRGVGVARLRRLAAQGERRGGDHQRGRRPARRRGAGAPRR